MAARQADATLGGTEGDDHMTTTFDVAQLGHELAKLQAHPHLRKVVFVLPLAEGRRDAARDFLAEGPPYDFSKAGIDAHEVFLTDREAVFVFSTPRGPGTLDAILADEDFWTVVASWERIAAGPPQLAETAFDWRADG
jgi:hypothetical protein